MSILWQDIRYSIRILLKSPGLTLAGVLSLALGIGMNVTMFSLANGILFKPLPVYKPDQLVRMYSSLPDGTTSSRISYPDYEDYRDQNRVFSGMAAIHLTPLTLSADSSSEQALAELVSGNYFSVLGLNAVRGRVFGKEEDLPASAKIAVVSEGLWKRRFGGNQDILGKTLWLNGEPHSIIGVIPGKFKGTFVGAVVDVWLPIQQSATWIGMDWKSIRNKPSVQTIARLRPGITIANAQAALNTIAAQLATAYPDSNRSKGIELVSATLLHGNFRKAASGFFAILMSLVILILLIACTNIASLLLSRAVGRRQEIAIRTALGASSVRLIRQGVTESIVLSLFGGTLGLFACLWTMELLMKFNPIPFVPFQIDLSPDFHVLIFTLILSLLTGIFLGLIPALRSARWDLFSSLKDRASVIAGHPDSSRLRSILLVSQVAFSLLLLICASLLVRSYVRAQSMNPGFEIQNTLAMDFDLDVYGYSETQGIRFYQNLLERLRGLSAVRSATLANLAPLDLATPRTIVVIPGHEPPPGQSSIQISSNIVAPEYFKTMNIPLMEGREFTERDVSGNPNVAVINQTMARKYWPNQDPIGKQFRYGEKAVPVQIVGVARNVKYRTLGEDPTSHLYLPFWQNYSSSMALLVRTERDPSALIGSIRSELQLVDKNVQGFFTRTLVQHTGFALLPARLGAIVVGLFGLLALVLSVIGIYGAVSYSVSQRTREIGVRMALGAQQYDLLRIVIVRGMSFTILGIGAGLVAAFGATRFLRSILYGISPTDSVTFIFIPLLLMIVAFLASYLPARRATHVDPMIALRYE
jgi:putative ABC transport system permease protein